MKLRSLSLAGVLLAGLCLRPAIAALPEDLKIESWLRARLDDGAPSEFLVRLRDASLADAPPSREVYDRLRVHAAESQAPLLAWLRSRGVHARSFYVVNAILVRGDLALAREIAGRQDVTALEGNPLVRGIEIAPPLITMAPGIVQAGPEWGVLAINADDVWAATGKRGEGIVVMSADTGVEWDHPALKAHYRGWDGTAVDHSYSWHDAILDLPVPLDDVDHGTHTTGTMVGDDGAGNQIGVAPGARYVACRNMDAGSGTPASYLDCMEWALAPYPPGGNPLTDGRPDLSPDIINNSWVCPQSEGCSANTLLAAFDVLRAAGIFAIAANGNSGSACTSTLYPPAIYASVFSAGAVDASNTVASFSSRGPVTADGSNRRKPDVTAPGVLVRSSVRGQGYASLSGTSMASPHLAGAVALLWSAKPQVRPHPTITQCLLERSAGAVVNTQTCGGIPAATRPNNVVGWGLVNVMGALSLGPDGDLDGIADVCDCASTDGGAFAVPGDVTDVRGSAPASISWASLALIAGSGTRYDVARGKVSELRIDLGFARAICQASALAGTATTDPSLPPVGDAFYYLVRARNSCGLGGWGSASSGAPRSIAVCP